MAKHSITLVLEGLTERIFIRQLLLTWFSFDPTRIGMDIYQLKSKQLSPGIYTYGSHDSEYYFQIIDAGSDEQVFSSILARVDGFVNAGYELVIGLSDMYGKKYDELAGNSTIHEEINARLIEEKQKIITAHQHAAHIRFHYAVMEVEAWMLAMPKMLSHYGVQSFCGIILSKNETLNITNPETQFYQPAKMLSKIAENNGRLYGKHEGNIEMLVSDMDRSDIESLYKSEMCPSFKSFMDTLIPDEIVSI